MAAIGKFLVFWGWKDREGGAHDFGGCFDTIGKAMDRGEGLADDARMSSWCHIARLDLSENTLKIMAVLALPGSEHYDDYTDDDDFEEMIFGDDERMGESNDDGEYWHWRKPLRW